MKQSKLKPKEFESKQYCLESIKHTSLELMKHKQHKSNINHSRSWLLYTLRLLANDYKVATRN